MKLFSLFSVLVFSSVIAWGQPSKGRWDGRLFLGSTFTHVDDASELPSSIDKSSDGYTQSEGSKGALALGIQRRFSMNESVDFSVGLSLSQRQLFIRNTDGNYTGVSNYKLTYLQVPVLFHYTFKEFTTNARFYLYTGPVVELKLKESLDGGDGAHYWNLANNNFNLDPTRGRNGSNTSMDLFQSFDFSWMLSGGVKYSFSDTIIGYGGIFVNPSFLNLINSKLTFDDSDKTPVNKEVSFRTTLVGLDVGILF
ncbi:MAG: PorT family protein [Cytophagaceae bacterium]|jgi:hypothetical protein|nr:PorT family protein [Cytophagaceae bacterium]